MKSEVSSWCLAYPVGAALKKLKMTWWAPESSSKAWCCTNRSLHKAHLRVPINCQNKSLASSSCYLHYSAAANAVFLLGVSFFADCCSWRKRQPHTQLAVASKTSSTASGLFLLSSSPQPVFDVACTIPYTSFVIARQRRKTGDTWWYCVSVTMYCMVV